jgi:hypothetical protein
MCDQLPNYTNQTEKRSVSEVFRVFQVVFRTSARPRSIVESDDDETQWAIGDWSGWLGRGDSGPHPGLYLVWLEDTAIDCGRLVGPSGISGRTGHLCTGGFPSLLHRVLVRGVLLRLQPEAEFPREALAGMWLSLRRGCGTRDEPGCFAIVRASCQGAV